MIVVKAVIRARKGKEKELEELLKDLPPQVAGEKGALEYSLHRDLNDPCVFFFYERYVDMEAVNFHMGAPYLQKALAAMPPLLDGEPSVKLFEKIGDLGR